MSVLIWLVWVAAAAILTPSPTQDDNDTFLTAIQQQFYICFPSSKTNSTSEVILFQEVWARSFCHTIETLVEVVQEYPGEVEYMYSPSCVPLVRCAGCCGDENLECHPTLTSNVTMQLLKLKPGMQGQEYGEMTFVEHKSCECRPRKASPKHDRLKPKGRGRKRKEKQRVKDCDGCQPPRR